ncbi:MAG: bifunctional hydroxymethylpyrimidine kinase/phosphomethylpyrimidine kinase [Acidobacteriota bacterium]|nr:MAG: bifunctional hydroxymethylpyrimidine kinase/phosphomethylpyrimidine kinase [Acidobacteriota bacterium]
MEQELKQLVSKLADTRILVIGDFLLDEFVFGEISRVSREAPVLILSYRDTKQCPGGGANTVANVAALMGQVIPLGVLGQDEASEELLNLWQKGVDTSHVIRDARTKTTRKTRILAGSFHSYQQQVVRIDFEQEVPLSGEIENELIARMEAVLPTVDAVILSDYSLGIMTSRVRTRAIELARKQGIPVVADSRDHPELYAGATTVTPNITEVEASLRFLAGKDPHRVEELGRRALQEWALDALLITRGKLGMSLFTPDGISHIPPYGSSDSVDVTGAGDTVAATYTAALAAGASFDAAARLANLAGGIVVMKKGTATVSPGELTTAIESL